MLVRHAGAARCHCVAFCHCWWPAGRCGWTSAVGNFPFDLVRCLSSFVFVGSLLRLYSPVASQTAQTLPKIPPSDLQLPLESNMVHPAPQPLRRRPPLAPLRWRQRLR
uniref:(northern house mosquito) hypothetical protein n=1 Tax=Culex pipiens TaxID=7175 RepID=A0A8D8CA45_CULPI